MVAKRIGIIVIAVGALTFGGYHGLKGMKSQLVRQEIDNTLADLPPTVDVTYGKVETPLWGNAADIHDVELSDRDLGYSYTVERLRVRDFDSRNEVPRHMHVVLENVELDNDEWDASLQQLGFGELFGTMEFQYRADDRQQTIESFARYRVDGIGELETSFSLDDAVLPASPDEPIAPDQFTRSRLRHADFSYRDDSLVPRLYEAFAEEQGLSVDEVKGLLVRTIDEGASAMGFTDTATAEAMSQLKQFVQKPERMYVSIEPNPPLDLQELSYTQPQGWPRLLNLTVRANP
ncbi:MAG: hypothetical protein AAGB13_00370 [Cyanobacteria bacterium P01_F01_bin.33]